MDPHLILPTLNPYNNLMCTGFSDALYYFYLHVRNIAVKSILIEKYVTSPTPKNKNDELGRSVKSSKNEVNKVEQISLNLFFVIIESSAEESIRSSFKFLLDFPSGDFLFIKIFTFSFLK